jgi:hypothetical protein
MNSSKVIENVQWDLLFQPDQWYVTPSVVQEHWQSLLVSFLACFLCFLFFLVGQQIVRERWLN